MRSSRPARTHRGLQKGQALTEMAIVAAVVVPLFLLVPVLAKYFHIKQTAGQAARTAAWEATVTADHNFDNLDAAAQRQRVLDRHFGLSVDPIATQASGAGDGDDVRSQMMNLLHRHLPVHRPFPVSAGVQHPVVRLQRGDVTLAPYGNESGGRVTTIIEGFSRIFELVPGASFPPNSNGLVTSELRVRPRNLVTRDGGAATFLDPFHAIDLDMTLQHTLLADAWNATGNGLENSPSHGHDRSALEQVQSLSPLSVMEPVADLFEDLGALDMLPVVGTISRFRPGYIQPDIVPHDKLEAYPGP